MVERLDRLSPETAPHGFYVAFRYVTPKSEDALRAMAADGVERAVAFTQYPQFSCATTGSSLNELWRAAAPHRAGARVPLERDRSLAGAPGVHRGHGRDRPRRAGAVRARASGTGCCCSSAPIRSRSTSWIAATRTPRRSAPACRPSWSDWPLPNRYLLAYQSEVGPVRWLGPSTERVIRRLGERGETRVLVVPIAFTSDHIETLSELDREYGELAHRVGITQYRRAPALNDRPAFIDAIADLVSDHLRSGEVCSTQYPLHCPGCVNPQCRNVLNPVGEVESPRVAGEVRP